MIERKLIAVNLRYWDTHDNCILMSELNKLFSLLTYSPLATSLSNIYKFYIKVKLDVQKYHGFQTKER